MFSRIQACFVGISDAEYGQKSVLVIKASNGKTDENIICNIEAHLGRKYMPDRVFTLETLGMTDLPINQTCKIVRADVQRAVVQYLHD